MESEDDNLLFSSPKQVPSPIHQTKLRRLKKASRVLISPTNETLDPIPSVAISISASDSFNEVEMIEVRKTLDLENLTDRILPMPASEGFGEECVADDGLDDLFPDRSRSKAQKELELETEFVFGGLDGEGDEEIDGLKMEKSVKKRRSSDGAKENEKKKKKRVESVGDDGKVEESARNRRKIEKERKAHLDLLHVESQRLLRETRDASFKPVPLVQKPISSVLEKIRLRKLEVLKRSGISDASDCIADTESSPRDITRNFEPQHAESNERRICNDADDDNSMEVVNPKSGDADASHVDGSDLPDSLLCRHDSMLSNTTFVGNSQNASQTLTNDAQDLLDEYRKSDTEDNQPECHDKSSQEDSFAPSSLVMNLKLDSAHLEDESSDEEYDDKENIDPHPQKLLDVGLPPKSDPVKAFVDDEAEEEDDSDNDLMRFRENEDDEENEENEEFDDLIVSGYKEMPIDNEKRDELHQKWLEQQDAAATDNVLRRFKSGWKQRDPTLLQEEEEEDELGEDSMDEAMDGLQPKNVARKNTKKVKEMIAHMFTDADDVFLSSDDEETEQRLVRQRLLEQTEEQASLLSPAEDESSREVFGRIKKLNIAPNMKRRAKTASSFFDTQSIGGNSNSSSKSSFLRRVSSNSLPSSHKQGLNMARSFIFARDDSNSRSSMSTSDHFSNMDQKENQPLRNASLKFSSSQSKSRVNNTNDSKGSSRPSLFEILRQSSAHSDSYNQNKTQSGSYRIEESQAVKQFAAFISSKRTMKMERS